VITALEDPALNAVSLGKGHMFTAAEAIVCVAAAGLEAVTEKTVGSPGSTDRGPLALDRTELPVLPWPPAAVGSPPPLAS
jgi:hypothetical protein